MLKKYKGCLLGAAIGDALGMPNESTSPNLNKMKYGYRRPFKRHPNEGLNPGQYTDDTQLMIVVATLIADGKYNEERYSTALCELYARRKLRFPDGSISAVCEHTVKENVPRKGVKSTAERRHAAPGARHRAARARPHRRPGGFYRDLPERMPQYQLL